GIYSLPDNGYTLSLGTGPDPDISLLFYPLMNQGKAELTDLAEKVFRYWAESPVKVASTEKINPGSTHWNVDLQQAAEIQIDTSQGDSFALFTQHTPEEFDLKVRDGGGNEIDPDEEHYFNAGHTHDDTVSSEALEFEGDLDPEKLNDWFSMLLQTQGPNIFRMKGIVSIAENDKRMVFQGVHMLFDAQPGEPWGDEARHNRLVFIGRELDRDFLEGGLKRCLS
ncbi:MAG: GTP-binding protein, partial [Pseudomonadales bacterium]|nr:GTP-binding protein [Pseudomonadales bacterium]